MTCDDFVLVAQYLSAARTCLQGGKEENDGWLTAIEAVTDAFNRDNSWFDRDRFVRTVDYGYPYYDNNEEGS